MKKREKKLSLNRETVLRLDKAPLPVQKLLEVKGGLADAPGFYTSCIEPNCCGSGTGGTD